MANSIPRVEDGDPITADAYNAIADAMEAGQVSFAQGSGIIHEESPQGRYFHSTYVEKMWIKITGHVAASKYSWVQQVEDVGGAWVDGPMSNDGTSDPAWEVSQNAAVTLSPAPVVPAWRDEIGLRFQAGGC